MKKTINVASTAEGNRAATSFTPPAALYASICPQYSSGGFSSQGSPQSVGVTQSWRSSISRATCA